MNVLFASAEVAPYVKVGGLADVVYSLPPALRKLKIDARVVMPLYGSIDRQAHQISYLFSFQLPRPTGTTDVHIHTTIAAGAPIYFVEAWPFFGDEAGVYGAWDWDVPRYIFFNQAVLALTAELRERIGWFPDVLHVNDWHTGLLPFLIADNAEWAQVASLCTIHNIAYQGADVGGWLWELGIPGRHQPDLVYQDLADNLLAISIAYSDAVTTVSPRYASEIKHPEMAYGLAGLIRARGDDVYGILNGIDTERWNPETDPHVVEPFNVENVAEKRAANKAELQRNAGLPVRDDVPVIGMVTRIDWQKGISLATEALRRLLVSTDAQLVALGTGDPTLTQGMLQLAHDFDWRAHMYAEFNPTMAQRIYAGCDLFLMPSHFEPCGIGQMIAMRYGALPLVRETGGLADTVANYDGEAADTGTGFMFLWEEPDALLYTLRWALETYRNRPQAWRRMQQRAMQTDFSWDLSARQYGDLYQKAIDKRSGS